MLWRDFSPYVLPFVVGCPTPVMEHHVRLAAIEFCRKTQCYRADLDPIEADGTAIFSMSPPEQTQVRQVKSVIVAGRGNWTVVGAPQGEAFVRTSHPADFCFTPDNLNLHLYALQPVGTLVTINAVLAPTLEAFELADAIGDEYAQDIAEGAIAKIKSLPKQEFSDPGGMVMHMANFKERINVTTAKIGRGLSDSKMRNFTTYL